MHHKLAGHTTLQDMIARTLEDSKQKLAAAESEKTKKLLAYEKKEHGHVPSVKEEEEEKKEKKAGVEVFDADGIQKLAAALDFAGDQLIKEADSIYNGGESHQGGEQLPTNKPVGGKQPYKHDKSKSHNVPMSTGLEKAPDAPVKNTVPTNMAHRPGGNAKMPDNILKVGGAETENASDSVKFILDKIAEYKGGGETLYSKAGEGPKPPSDSKGGNDARKWIESNQAAIKMQKVDGKKPQKRMLSEVLTEPAYSKAHDSKVHENLRNASKGGVKIAAATALLQKIAAEGCTCDGEGNCRYCKMKKAMEKKSMGGAMPAMSTGSLPTTPKPPLAGM